MRMRLPRAARLGVSIAALAFAMPTPRAQEALWSPGRERLQDVTLIQPPDPAQTPELAKADASAHHALETQSAAPVREAPPSESGASPMLVETPEAPLVPVVALVPVVVLEDELELELLELEEE